jgi:DNA-binding MarR family transcriptional regulator
MTSSELSPDDYRALLAEVYELAGRSRRQSDAEASVYGSTAARWQTMSALSDNDLTVAAVARRLGLPRQAVHRVVDDLVTQGHVQKRPNPDHVRSELVSLTAEGRSLLHRLWRESDQHRLAILTEARISQADLDTTREVLSRIVTAFNKVPNTSTKRGSDVCGDR